MTLLAALVLSWALLGIGRRSIGRAFMPAVIGSCLIATFLYYAFGARFV